MLQAMLAGSAAIRAHQSRMNVIGNNLANINTTAFRASRLGFMDLMSNTLRGASAPNGGNGGLNPVQIGTGVMIGSTSVDPSNGSMSGTNRPTDLALAGNGYFIVGNGAANYYTRDGGFDLDAAGNLVHRGTGLVVQGWNADASGAVNASGATGGLRVPTGVTSSAHGTTTARLEGNLNASADGDAEVTTTMTVYDSLGNSRQISVRFFNHTTPAAAGAPDGATSSWDWEALDGTTVVGSSASGGSPLGFDGNGSVVGTGGLSITLAGAGGASDQTVAVNVSGVRQLAQSSQVRLANQDGYGPGSLTSFSIVPDGTVVGIFSNGQTQALGRIATAVFANSGGMNQEGGNLWSPSANSGDAIVGAPGAGGQPAVYAGYLETSNVDLGNEFTDMIVTQRGYQANTRVITTADEMMQEALQIKR